MIWLGRILAVLFLAWAFGFLWFVLSVPGPAAVRFETDAVVVPTGAGGRIQRGLAVLDAGLANRMLVTGVDPEVKPGEFAAQFNVSSRQLRCCITLGQKAMDTRGNAAETADWLEEYDYSTIRLVTSDWHMRRATRELQRTLPPGMTIYQDAVTTPVQLDTLFLEYHKYLAVLAGGLLGRA